MANINLNQLVSTTDELSIDESSEIIGGNILQTISAITRVATGISQIGTGISSLDRGFKTFPKPKPKASTPTLNDPNILTTMAIQDFFS